MVAAGHGITLLPEMALHGPYHDARSLIVHRQNDADGRPMIWIGMGYAAPGQAVPDNQNNGIDDVRVDDCEQAQPEKCFHVAPIPGTACWYLSSAT